jgi:hypothetical protein
MDELGENLLLAPNEQVCLLFDQHDALKVKEEIEMPSREDIMVIRYDSASSSASNSPNSSLTPSPQRDLSPPSSSESCEEYHHFSNPNPAPCVVNVEDDDEDDVKDEDEEDISRGYMSSFMKNGSLNMPDNTLFSVQGTDKQRKRKRINKVTFVGETNIMWEDYVPTENSVILFQDNQILYVDAKRTNRLRSNPNPLRHNRNSRHSIIIYQFNCHT